jgi:uncharacterized membrane protein YdbT with pleckstrin-like domain
VLTRGPRAGEEVLLDTHPHWRTVFWPVVLVPLVIGAASYGIFSVPGGSFQAGLRWAIVAVAALVLLAWSARPFLRWQRTRYVLTDRRLVLRRGVLSRRGRDLPLRRVADVSFEQSLGERAFRCGTLVVESSGEHSQLKLRGMPRVRAVHAELNDLLDDLG